jgi:hypothetical protein
METKKQYLSIYDKLRAIEVAEKKGNYEAAEVFNTDPKSIREWRINKLKYMLVEDPKNTYTLHKGPTLEDEELGEKILKYIKELRKDCLQVTSELLIYKTLEFRPNFKNNSLTNLYQWVRRLLKRNNLTIRRITSKGASVKADGSAALAVRDYLQSLINMRVNYPYQLGDIINMDETPIYVNNTSNYSIESVGVKQVPVKTNNNIKERISCILTISADGCKYPPVLIFKGVSDGRVMRELSDNQNVKEGRIGVFVNNNAWCTQYVFGEYAKFIFMNNNYFDDLEPRKILVMDGFSGHEGSEDILEKFNVDSVFLPPQTTHLTQPLDVAINGLFKMKVKAKILMWNIANGNVALSAKQRRSRVIEIVLDVWENEIPKDLVVKSFVLCGISSALDGSDYNKLYPPLKSLIENSEVSNLNQNFELNNEVVEDNLDADGLDEHELVDDEI